MKPLVDTVKQVIKDRKADSPSKVLALKLLHRCAQGDEIFMYMEKKIMSRLGVFARHRKDSNDLERGVSLFGKTANHKASADFLKLLLLYLQAWAARFPMYPASVSGNLVGKQTEIAKIYQALVKEKVTFPSEAVVMQSLCTDYLVSEAGSGYNPSSTGPQSLNHSGYIMSSRPATAAPQVFLDG